MYNIVYYNQISVLFAFLQYSSKNLLQAIVKNKGHGTFSFQWLERRPSMQIYSYQTLSVGGNTASGVYHASGMDAVAGRICVELVWNESFSNSALTRVRPIAMKESIGGSG